MFDWAKYDIMTTPTQGMRRIPVYRPVFIKLSNGRIATAKIVNISEHGIGIVFNAPGKVGADLDVRFLLPVKCRLFEITATAKLTHCHVSDDKFYSYLEFTDICNEDARLVKGFLDDKSVFFPIAA